MGVGQGLGQAAALEFGFGLFDLGRDGFGCGAAIASGFATHQVIGLDRCSAFVDGQNVGVTVMLGCAGFFDETHAAVNLYAK